jgi:CubicO group peptidase (beta-lactamase class C family)
MANRREGRAARKMTNTGVDPALADKTQALMAHYGVPGVAVGIWHQDQEQLAGFGVTNVRHPLPVDADTLFQIGSTTKTFTATVAMILTAQGKLELDRPIRHYLPEFRLQDPAATAGATLRHCFTHTGGWLGDYFADTGDGNDALARYVAELADQPQQTPLGELWSYNNAGFSLAGRVIEVVAGQPFEAVVRELLLEPLGMDHSFFFAKEVMTHRFAVGHIVNPATPEAEPQVAEPWALTRSAHPAGGVISTVRDLLRYARFHLGDGRTSGGLQLLPPDQVRWMQQPLAEAGSMADAVGLSWLLSTVGGEASVGHGGATHGQLSAFRMIPARGFAITVLTNANRGGELHRDLVVWALDHYLGLRTPEPEITPGSPTDLGTVAGRYVARLSHVEVTLDGDALQVQFLPQGGFPDKDSPPGPQMPPSRLAFVGEDRLLFVEGPAKGGRVELGRDSEGQVAWMRVGGRIHRRVED